MSTIVTLTLDKDHRKARLALSIDKYSTLYDETNKRWKTGAIKAAISALSSSGSLGAGETMTVTISPANYNPSANDQAKQVTTGTTAISLAAAYDHTTAFNAGAPDPSANVNADGTIDLVYIDFELSIGATSSHVLTLTHTIGSLNAVDTYSALSSATSDSMTLAIEPESDRDFGIITLDGQGAANAYIAVQLVSLTSSVTPGEFPEMDQDPVFSVETAPHKGGVRRQICRCPLPKSQSRTKVFASFYTVVFALNGGKIDANSTKLQKPDAAYDVQYDLLNVSLEKASMAKVAAALAYAYKLVSI